MSIKMISFFFLRREMLCNADSCCEPIDIDLVI